MMNKHELNEQEKKDQETLDRSIIAWFFWGLIMAIFVVAIDYLVHYIATAHFEAKRLVIDLLSLAFSFAPATIAIIFECTFIRLKIRAFFEFVSGLFALTFLILHVVYQVLDKDNDLIINNGTFLACISILFIIVEYFVGRYFIVRKHKNSLEERKGNNE